jgi:hypothetical protein
MQGAALRQHSSSQSLISTLTVRQRKDRHLTVSAQQQRQVHLQLTTCPMLEPQPPWQVRKTAFRYHSFQKAPNGLFPLTKCLPLLASCKSTYREQRSSMHCHITTCFDVRSCPAKGEHWPNCSLTSPQIRLQLTVFSVQEP